MRICILCLCSVIITVVSHGLACAKEDFLASASRIAVSGMQAQGQRLKIIAQNIANADVTASAPEGEPYRRQIIFFENVYDEQAKTSLLKVAEIQEDESEFERRYLPTHPAADKDGFVQYPNVNKIIEVADAKEAQISFEANATSLEMTKSNQNKIIDLMR